MMIRVLIGFVVLWAVLDQGAALSGSMRGEAGLLVCAVVIAAAVFVERTGFRRPPVAALRDLGFRWPHWRATLLTLALSLALLAFFPLYGLATGVPITLQPNAAWLALGMLAQGGIAEETVFRGFLFRHLREGRTFWQAAWISAIPFVAVHLTLFLTLDPAVAAASVAVALALSFPFAWLFERGGNSVLLPAMLHFAVQGLVKLIAVPDAAQFTTLAIAWMAVSASLPWAVSLLRPPAPIPPPPNTAPASPI